MCGLKADGELRLSALLFKTQEADEEEEKAEADEPEKQRNAEGGKENSYVRDKKYCTTHETSLRELSFTSVSLACMCLPLAPINIILQTFTQITPPPCYTITWFRQKNCDPSHLNSLLPRIDFSYLRCHKTYVGDKLRHF